MSIFGEVDQKEVRSDGANAGNLETFNNMSA